MLFRHAKKEKIIIVISDYFSLTNGNPTSIFWIKKSAEAAKAKLATLLMLGRSFNVHVLISQQRPDAEYFSKARDNFNVVIALGNLSKEAVNMFSGFDKDAMEPVSSIGSGYILTNGTMKSIQVPQVKSMEKVERYIRRAL